ncbi:MAG: chloride channel protein [Bacteroidetes bacterium]|nr:MAG: chloride channel protein [Bacteroidota bacterium]
MKWLHKFLVWRIKHVRDRNFLIYLGILIGIVSGLAAVTLKGVVHWMQSVLVTFAEGDNSYLYHMIYPLIGIVLTVVVSQYVLKANMGHGITAILYNISKKSSILSRTKMYSRMVTSAITVGFGGSVGLEAPIVVTGSAIGSNIGRLVHLNYKKRTLLIGCGAAAAISAIFNSPIAGVIFAIEVLLTDVTIAMFIPLLISSVFGSLVSKSLLGDDILFSFKLIDNYTLNDLPFIILMGIIAGLLSVYFTRTTFWVEGKLAKIKGTFTRAVLGGIGLGILILLMSPLYGEGYETIKALVHGDVHSVLSGFENFGIPNTQLVAILFFTAVIFFKPVASALTIGSGGSGGIFAPSLFIGGVLGFVFASTVNLISGTEMLSVSNFTLVGMSGLMSGILHAPLTAIFLIAEITSGYTLFVPLMLVSAIAYSTSIYFESHSLYAKHLAQSGDLIPADKDKRVLREINIDKVIETDLLKVAPEATLGELVSLVRKSKRNLFPVVNVKGELVGILTLDDIRDIMFNHEQYDKIFVNSLMHTPPANVSPHENMQSVMQKFEATGAWNLPVLDDGKYVGFLSKSRIFSTYRNKLRSQNIA